MSKKRYETMTKEEMLEFLTKCRVRFCEECPAYGGYKDSISYFECCVAYLKGEVTMKKRWQTIGSDEDLKRMRGEYLDFCQGKRCRECELGKTETSEACFVKYLCEEIEVAE